MNFALPDTRDSLYIPAEPSVNYEFEELYSAVRAREQRMYTDEELFQLPETPSSHPHSKEWQIRKHSCQQLRSYLESKKSNLYLLEIGCGNGWLSYELSRIPGSSVIGIDINLLELQQAARVFNKNSQLKFIYGDIRSGLLKDLKFDAIVFAASIQYFPDLPAILRVAGDHLYPGGEIHLIDTHLYKPIQVAAAAERTKSYYLSLGFPQMANYYFHHSISELESFNYKILRDPNSFRSILFNRKNPFYWICIKKHAFSN